MERKAFVLVTDLPADGTREIRWWLSASAKWGPWVRVVRDTQSDVGRRAFDAHDPTARATKLPMSQRLSVGNGLKKIVMAITVTVRFVDVA